MLESFRAASELPRLLYIGDVPVEASHSGPVVLYRLLQRYPPDRLCIAEAGPWLSTAEQRLPDVRYEDRRLPLSRLVRSRFAIQYWSLVLILARLRARLFKRLAREFRPDAVISVAQGVSCITAASLAANLGVPFHLVCHDEWHVRPLFCGSACRQRIFGWLYRAAASRLCVSPFMAEEYERRYQTSGALLYPSRAADAIVFEAPAPRLAKTTGELVCAYAGTVYTLEDAAALQLLGECLLAVGGRLLIFGPMDAKQARSFGLSAPNIQLGGFLPSQSLVSTLRERADVLFVPMSFTPDHRINMELAFPSKLTEYTAAGLPLLIHGPKYCSAVRWAETNAPVAEVVTADGGVELSRAVQRLASDPDYRTQLARAALAAGERYFSYEAAYAVFSAALGAGVADKVGESRSAALHVA
jgi:glycosyltransferase involved in cell wall biosynthesis